MLLVILLMVLLAFFGMSFTGQQQDYLLEFKCDMAKSVSDLIYGSKDYKSANNQTWIGLQTGMMKLIDVSKGLLDAPAEIGDTFSDLGWM